MRYRVKHLEIRSENAAKPITSASKALTGWIRAQAPVYAALDYGCGKLRYAGELAECCRKMALVDSAVQLDRLQRIDGKRVSIRDYARCRWPHCRTMTPDELDESAQRYNLALCANVLSAIPSAWHRSVALQIIRRSLARNGKCMFVTQYRNSYFANAAKSPNAISHLDGWILATPRGNFYYGLLAKPRLEKILQRAGFRICESWTTDGSAFVLATRG